MKTKVGIIGCGNIAVNGHVPALKELHEVEVVGVADPVAQNRQQVLDLLGLPQDRGHTDHRALLDEGVHYVALTVPPKFRRAIVEDCASAGVHVLSEKPISTIPADGRAMIDTMRDTGLRIGMVHNYHYFPHFAKAHQLIDEGAIGQLRHVTLQWLGMSDWPGSPGYKPRWRHDMGEAGGGILMDMLHAMYMAAWYIGPIYAVSAVVDQLNDGSGSVEDFSLVHLYGRDAYATVNMWWGRGPNGAEFSGTGGQIRHFGGDHHCPEAAQPFTLFNDSGRREYSFDNDYIGSFPRIHTNFIQAIQNDVNPLAPAEAGLAALEATLAAYISAATGRVVSLPLPSDHPVFLAGVAALNQLELWEAGPVVQHGIFGMKGA